MTEKQKSDFILKIESLLSETSCYENFTRAKVIVKKLLSDYDFKFKTNII